MRRAAFITGSAAVATAASSLLPATLAAPARSIYTTWGSIPCEAEFGKESWLKRITSQSAYRSYDFYHVPEVTGPSNLNLNAVETYLLSCIEDDTNRLLGLSWGYDFDPFWRDRVESHDTLYRILYTDDYPIFKFIFGSCRHKELECQYVMKKLNYLKSVHHWAAMTERRFTAVNKSMYYIQRKVWNALERERYLCGSVEIVEAFRARVPEEFKEKAMAELDVALTNMRHWVHDCPNGKRTFTRRLA